MGRVSFFVVAGFYIASLNIRQAAAVPILDQSYTDEIGYFGIGDSAAETFTVGITGKLVRVDLRIGREGNARGAGDDPVAFLTAGPVPNQTALGAITLPRLNIPDPIVSGAYTSLDFSGQNVFVTAGEILAIILQQRDTQINWGLGPQNLTVDPYPDGASYIGSFNSNSWIVLPNQHFNFKTFVEPVPEPSALVLASLGIVGLLGIGWRRRWPARLTSAAKIL